MEKDFDVLVENDKCTDGMIDVSKIECKILFLDIIWTYMDMNGNSVYILKQYIKKIRRGVKSGTQKLRIWHVPAVISGLCCVVLTDVHSFYSIPFQC